MRKVFLVCVCFIAITCSSERKAAFEYDDVSNGLHLQVPNHSWIIQYDPSCNRQFCWDLTKPENGARIYLAKISWLDSRGLVVESNKLRDELLVNHAKDLTRVSNVSWLTVTPGASFVYFSWDVGASKLRFHGAYLQLISDSTTTKVYLFVAGSPLKYGEQTEQDFVDFLKNVGPVVPKTLNQQTL
ncbi:MAG: hypothetical protein G01um101413_41 [Parcubacteria group bacterium Gr01-1014_13]|nr:MAG: hypothetical protein G01um101413_41 [Parcubacteria group bacterium Gr01-1014_13]